MQTTKENINKAISIVENLQDGDLISDQTRYIDETGKCCLIGEIGRQMGCKDSVIEHWIWPDQEKPCLVDLFGQTGSLWMDRQLSDIHSYYVAGRIDFAEMKAQAIQYLRTMI